MATRTTRTILTLGLSLFVAAPALAADGDGNRSTSRHTFRGMSLGTADQLAARPFNASDAQIVRAQPLRGETQTIGATSSTSSAITSDLSAPARIAGVPMRNAVAVVTPATNMITTARQATPLVVAAAADDQQPQIDDRAAVDNNARIARNYNSYQPTTVSYENAELALAAHRVQTVSYGNTYGTYSPASYHGQLTYSYAPRTYYRPATYCAPSNYYGYSTVYYSSAPRYYGGYYTSGYCAPTYYRPSYSYGGYYGRGYYGGGSYYGGYYGRYNCGSPSYGFSYGYSKRGGSAWGFSIGW